LRLQKSLLGTSPQPLRELTSSSHWEEEGYPQNLPNFVMGVGILSLGFLPPAWLALKAFKSFQK